MLASCVVCGLTSAVSMIFQGGNQLKYKIGVPINYLYAYKKEEFDVERFKYSLINILQNYNFDFNLILFIMTVLFNSLIINVILNLIEEFARHNKSKT